MPTSAPDATPVTRSELKAELHALETRLTEQLNAAFRGLREYMDERTRELREYIDERTHDAETRLLRSFSDDAPVSL